MVRKGWISHWVGGGQESLWCRRVLVGNRLWKRFRLPFVARPATNGSRGHCLALLDLRSLIVGSVIACRLPGVDFRFAMALSPFVYTEHTWT